MSKYRGYLTGSGNQVSRAGSATSGIRARLSSSTGANVYVSMGVLPSGQEIVRMRIETNAVIFPESVWTFNEQGVPVPFDEA